MSSPHRFIHSFVCSRLFGRCPSQFRSSGISAIAWAKTSVRSNSTAAIRDCSSESSSSGVPIQIVPLWLAHEGMSGAGRRFNAVRFRQDNKFHQNTNQFHRSRRSPWRGERTRHFAPRTVTGARFISLSTNSITGRIFA